MVKFPQILEGSGDQAVFGSLQFIKIWLYEILTIIFLKAYYFSFRMSPSNQKLVAKRLRKLDALVFTETTLVITFSQPSLHFLGQIWLFGPLLRRKMLFLVSLKQNISFNKGKTIVGGLSKPQKTTKKTFWWAETMKKEGILFGNCTTTVLFWSIQVRKEFFFLFEVL